eukprot:TRINITY_DN9920_c2_g1_i1.p1 TRINITY_DN9920_c2_g1~~TRINITY_DN9920_c2_g1_i1.p1  ORF type:complete len:295 (+),score=33.96 TRINITY_DN9920_c2_g1_i1:35-886(+)
MLLVGVIFLQLPVTWAVRHSTPADATSSDHAHGPLADWLSKRCPALRDQDHLRKLNVNLPRLNGSLEQLSSDGLREQTQIEELIKRTHALAIKNGWQWKDILKSAKRNPLTTALGAGALAFTVPYTVLGAGATALSSVVGFVAGVFAHQKIRSSNVSTHHETWNWKEESTYYWEKTVKELLPLQRHLKMRPEHGLGIVFLETVDILSSYLADSQRKDTPPFFPDMFAKSRSTLLFACEASGKDIEVCHSEMTEPFGIETAASAVQLLGDDLAKLGIGTAQCGL